MLTGELDVSTVPAFNKRMSELRHRGFHSMVLDLSGVTFMDSTGLSAILVAEMHARMRGQRFSVVEGPPHVNELFRLTGVDNFLEMVRPAPAARPATAADETGSRSPQAGSRGRCVTMSTLGPGPGG